MDINTKKTIRKQVILAGKLFILIAVLLLVYQLYMIRNGYSSSPEKKMKIAQQIWPFELPEGYTISFASNGFYSRIMVLDNDKTKQRIVMNQVNFRKERKPDGFARKFNHPDESIKMRRSTFTGINNPLIEEYGSLDGKKHPFPYVRIQFDTPKGLRKGVIYCFYCPVSDRSFFIESSGPVDSFSPAEVESFVMNLGECP